MTEKQTGRKAPWLGLYELLGSATVALAAISLLSTLAVRPFQVSGSSMSPTLAEGDMLLVRTLLYTPRQGDVVILRQEDYRDTPLVKRVIATGGQTVSIDYAAGAVLVDGVALEEPYIAEAMVRHPAQTIDELTVPEGCVFVMGDNRNVSGDSRDPACGPVDSRKVIGQAVAVIFPLTGLRPVQ